MIDGFPRRNRLDLHSPAEAAIRAAVDAVESSGAHPLLTDAVNLLHAARDKVADFVELPLEHEASEKCWCEPEINFVDPKTGNTVYVHRELQR